MTAQRIAGKELASALKTQVRRDVAVLMHNSLQAAQLRLGTLR